MPAEGTLTASDGTLLFYRRWDAFQPKAVCLLVHGLAEHSGRYEALAQALVHRRFFVWAMDHRGHGRSGGPRVDCTGVSSLVEDLRGLRQKAAEAMPSLPHIMIGHSLGGLIALSYAVRYAADLRGVAVSSPAFKLTHETPAWKVRLVTATSRVFPSFPFQNGVHPEHLSHDPKIVEDYKRDPLIPRTLTARCASALNEDMKSSHQLAGQLKIPCLILQGSRDEICDPARMETFSRAIHSAPVTLRRYEGLYHELFNEPQREQVIDDLIRWMEEVI